MKSSPPCGGIFFEDINYAAEGSLYGEMVRNRSFEFSQSLMGWKTFGKLKLKKVFLKPGNSNGNLFNTTNYSDICSREIEFQNSTTLQTTLVEGQDLTVNFFVHFRF